MRGDGAVYAAQEIFERAVQGPQPAGVLDAARDGTLVQTVAAAKVVKVIVQGCRAHTVEPGSRRQCQVAEA
jgi:hypothetical protein